MISGLPNGWTEVELEDHVYIAGRIGWRGLKRSEYTNDGPLFLAVKNILPDGNIDFSDTGHLSQERFDESTEIQLQMNDILLTKDGTIGKVGIVHSLPGPTTVNSSILVVRPNNELLLNKYLFHYLRGPQFQSIAQERITGSAIPHLFQKDIKKLRVLVPPLREQHRIVAKLDELLGKVGTCKKRLERIPTLLKRFRQSVLAAACSGSLTADWREKKSDLETADELFKKIKAHRHQYYEELCKRAIINGKRRPKHPDTNEISRNLVGELPNIPETWGYFRLEELCHLISDGTHKTPKYQQEGIPFLSVKNVRPFLIRDNDIKFISEEDYVQINSRCNPEIGDILYTKVGATFGYAAVNNLEYPFSIFVSLALIKPVKHLFSSEYAEIVMNSDLIFKQARERVSGIGTPDLHLIEIRDFRTPLPPIPEQQEIVRRVEALFKVADQIEARYAKAHVDKLSQSILAKAFRGELVPQDPNDEPAYVLLERIQATRRAAVQPSTKPQRKKRMRE